MERLAQRGHEIRVIDYEIDWHKAKSREKPIQPRLTTIAGEKTVEGVTITVVRPPIIRARYLDILSEAMSHSAEIEWQISKFRPDVVVSLGIINAYVGSMICKRAGVPHIYYLIDSLETLVQVPAFKGFARGLISGALKASTRVLVINDELGNYAARLGADPRRITVLGAGVDTTRINPSISGDKIRSQLGIGSNDFVLFFMGWLYPFSGLKEVAESLGKVNDPHLRLLVLGRGELSGELERLKNESLRDRLIIVPWKPYGEIPSYLASSNVCLLPSHRNEVTRNIVPIKMYEYLAAGKPVIATSLPGLRTEFGTSSGVIYIDRSEEAVDVARRLSRDNFELERLASQATSYVSERSWAKLTAKFENILLEEPNKIQAHLKS
jgi:glycosyltransferase involved in cell wall biosynthesis